MAGASEFDVIGKYFAPLAADADGAFGLTDDAALLPSADYIVTKDILIAGVHFLPRDRLDLVARKLLRVNLSDMAAKGGRPTGYFLGCVWPMSVKERQIAAFAEGLAVDQAQYRLPLYGGDTTVHKAKGAPLTLSATLFGAPARTGMIRRNGAHHGDDLYVSGTLGDAGLGLRALTKAEKFPAADKSYLVDRYRLPSPRLTLGGALAGLASAAIDVSDGLMNDAAHIARASGLAIDINAGALPLSTAAAAWLDAMSDRSESFAALATFGDDYEILFTAPQSMRRAVAMAGQVAKTPIARIGTVQRGEGVRLIADTGDEIETAETGFDHFSRAVQPGKT